LKNVLIATAINLGMLELVSRRISACAPTISGSKAASRYGLFPQMMRWSF
jgi:hypothetical protein